MNEAIARNRLADRLDQEARGLQRPADNGTREARHERRRQPRRDRDRTSRWGGLHGSDPVWVIIQRLLGP
jgi:hypothetical protein